MTNWTNKTITHRNGKPVKARTDGEVWQIRAEKVVYGPYFARMEDFIDQLKEASKGILSTEVRGYGNYSDGSMEIQISGWREADKYDTPYLPQ
ncbi:MAG: hypothetical protein H9W81_07895 [Enterococcus sp.]|nr:hypothetical protein [Enterococcus sp.]